MSTLGLGGWQVQSSAVVGRDGAIISEPEYPTGPWLYVTPDDAGAPGTEIEALLQSGACPNVFYSTNMRTCFGYEPDVGQVRVPEFAVPWWFRTDFELIESSGTMVDLIINGVVGAADVFVDGHEVANHTEVTGDYTRFTFDVSGLVKPGQNAVALEVYPNNPKRMFTLDDVDWNQVPPDNNTGIQFPVQIGVSKVLSLSNAYVTQQDAPGLTTAALTVHSDVTNVTRSPLHCRVTATVLGPTGSVVAAMSQVVTVPPTRRAPRPSLRATNRR